MIALTGTAALSANEDLLIEDFELKPEDVQVLEEYCLDGGLVFS